MVEMNKLLVPTPPIYATDSTGIIRNADGSYKIQSGEDPTSKNPIEGALSSFSDAPGGFKEEWREINWSFGAEYTYNKQLSVRGGYFYEHPTKGGRQYVTMGAGVKYSSFSISLSYLIPTFQLQRSPLENTLRFSVQFDLGAFKSNNNANTPNETPNN
jgi:long-subunit fatty acid transport protein